MPEFQKEISTGNTAQKGRTLLVLREAFCCWKMSAERQQAQVVIMCWLRAEINYAECARSMMVGKPSTWMWFPFQRTQSMDN